MTLAPENLFVQPINPLAIAAARLRTGGKSTYYDDPAGFAKHCIQWPREQGLTEYQNDILTALGVEKRAAVRGPHGLGKSALSAIAILWFATTRDQAGVDWKVATTAGAWRQLIRYLWPEIHKWSKRLRPEMIGRPRFTRNELLALNLNLHHGSAFAVASSDPQLIEGVHADEVLYIFDESKSIDAGVFDAAEGAFSGAGPEGGALAAYALAVSTPGSPNGRFYDIHKRVAGFEDWWTRHVTKDECIAAGRMSADWAEARARQWGVTSGIYANRVLGEFHSDDKDGLIPLGWVEAANERWRQWVEDGSPAVDGPRTVGVDVARSGEDATVLALRNGPAIVRLDKHNKEDTMQTTGRVKGILDADPAMTAIVDVIGVGGGVVDRLREQKLKVEAFNASEATEMKERAGELGFANTRAAAWWLMRELLDPAYDSDLMLPDDDLLTGDLCTPTWKVQSGGKILVESKDDIRKRLGRSTDCGDAVVQAFWDGADHTAEAWIKYLRDKTAAAADEKPEPVPTDDREAMRQAAFRQRSGR